MQKKNRQTTIRGKTPELRREVQPIIVYKSFYLQSFKSMSHTRYTRNFPMYSPEELAC